MKKIYYFIILGLLIVAGILVFLFSGWNQVVTDLILIIIIILIVRFPIIRLLPFFIKKRFIRGIISSIINIIIIVFSFMLLFVLSPDTFIFVFSFVIISISLNFKKFITNIVSGAILLTSEQFEIGDLIEINDVQGIVTEIDLNYTRIQEFDGITVIIPNSNVYGSNLTKFTHKKYMHLEPPKPGASEKKVLKYKKYLTYLNKLLSTQPKITKYVKSMDILEIIEPEKLDTYLKPIFDKYQEIFTIRPDYIVDMTRYGRVKLNFYISAKNAELIVNNIDAFLRDLIFQLYNKDIYKGWEIYQETLKNQKQEVKN